MTLQETKKDYDVIRPITGDVPCGRSNRNPSNIMNMLAFLNVRLQCNIRGAESQCSAGDEMQSLQCVHFSYMESAWEEYIALRCLSSTLGSSKL